ncbi:MAG: TlpA family protein disulfide reductase [Rhodocyclales bacterium]|nr:TlpA family protein disulfide reductase [Rhodocyclales bacterium]
MKTLFSLLLLCLLGMAMPAAATPGEVAIGQTLREANMQGLTGPARKLSEFRGKPLIINVWASWCGPCRAEMGSLDRLARRYGKQFNVIGISTDDYTARANTFLKAANTAFPHFIDNRLELENMLGADRIPLTLLIDAQGKVLGKYYGAKEWDSPEAIETIGKGFGLRL